MWINGFVNRVQDNLLNLFVCSLAVFPHWTHINHSTCRFYFRGGNGQTVYFLLWKWTSVLWPWSSTICCPQANFKTAAPRGVRLSVTDLFFAGLCGQCNQRPFWPKSTWHKKAAAFLMSVANLWCQLVLTPHRQIWGHPVPGILKTPISSIPPEKGAGLTRARVT